jgi:hypothetical protein
MIKWKGMIGLTMLAVIMSMMVACGPSSDAAVEKVLQGVVRVDSTDFKALTPAQQAEVLRLARARNQVVVGDEQRY